MRHPSPRLSVWLAVAAVMLGCGTPRPGSLRFANQDPVWRVDDRRSIPQPEKPYYSNAFYGMDADYFRAATYALEVPARRRARNLNSLDEVPNSTWFTNRNGMHPVTLAAIRRGPGQHAGPDASRPWTVVGAKVGGMAVGFRIEDARGDGYLLKFDSPGHPEVETGADVAAQRLLWAAGYNVSDNDVVYFSPEQLDEKPGGDGPDRAEIDRLLAKVAREPDGRYRALASRFIAGEVIGGITPEGVRPDDPNDTVPHEDRREMRGLGMVAAWLNHTDIKPANTLDVWVADPADPTQHYVVHYLLDYGKALGAMARVDPRPHDGFAHATDFEHITKSFVTLGIRRRPWEGIGPFPRYRGLGWLESRQFDPARWKPLHPWIPFQAADRFDAYWGAKLVMSFTPRQIRAALEAGKYSDRRTVAYLTRVLLERQRVVGQYAFQQVAPLDRFHVAANHKLCFDDMWVRYRLGPSVDTVFLAVAYGGDGDATGWRRAARPDPNGRACVPHLPTLSPGEYLIVEIEASRGGQRLPPLFVHVAAPMGRGAARVVGIRRE